MDWAYLLGPSAFQIALGFVIAKLFDALAERRQDRRLNVQLAAERERLEIQLAAEKERLRLQERVEIRKRLFDSKFEAALRITRLLKGIVYTLRTQMVAHAAAYSEGKLDVERFRAIRDRAFDQLQSVAREGEDATAVIELLFVDVSFNELPHQAPFMKITFEWQQFLDRQGQFLLWLQQQRIDLPSMLPVDAVREKEQAITDRQKQMLTQVHELLALVNEYDDAVSRTIRVLADALKTE